jgi:nucleoid-associated protein YgaU
MNSSKTAALILGPSLVIVLLLVGAYWFKTRPAEVSAPLELHSAIAGRMAVSEPPPSVPPPAPDMNASAQALSNTTPNAPAEANAAAPGITPPSAITPSSPAVPPPKFDVVRVEPSGDAVVAGHTEPDSKVAVIANGKVVAEGKSDAAGQFVLLPPALPPGEHSLALQVTPQSGQSVVSDQNVAVSVPAKGKGDVMVALAEPGKATVLLADPTARAEAAKPDTSKPDSSKPDIAKSANTKSDAPKAQAATAPNDAPAPPPKPEVAIKTAEIVEPGGFFATGIAAPNAHLRIYLNGSPLAEVTAGPDGHWTIKVGKGLVAGHYAVRADQIDGAGKVVARAEVPFDYSPAAKTKEAQATPAMPAAKPKEAQAQTMAPSADAPSATVPPASGAAPDNAKEHSFSTASANPGTGTNARPLGDVAAPAKAATPSTDDRAAGASEPTVEQAQSTASPAAGSASAVVAEIQTATVQKGSNLWRISHDTLGRGTRYTEIYAANATQIRDPSLIYPGQVFVIPGQTN